MRNFRFLWTAACMVLVLSTSAIQAQTAEEILENYYETIGGKDNWMKLQSMTMNGKFMMQGQEFPVSMVKKKGDKMKMEIDIQGKKFVQAYDGALGWQVNPFMGSGTPEKMNEDDTKETKKQAEFEDELMVYKEDGHKVELVGKEDVAGTSCFKIKFTRNDGEVKHYFIDSEEFVPVMSRQNTKMQGQEIETETFYSGYKKVNGFVIPFDVETKVKGQTVNKIINEKIEFDVPVEDSVFNYAG